MRHVEERLCPSQLQFPFSGFLLAQCSMAPQVKSVSLEEQVFSQSAHPSNDFPVADFPASFGYPLFCSDSVPMCSVLSRKKKAAERQSKTIYLANWKRKANTNWTAAQAARKRQTGTVVFMSSSSFVRSCRSTCDAPRHTHCNCCYILLSLPGLLTKCLANM